MGGILTVKMILLIRFSFRIQSQDLLYKSRTVQFSLKKVMLFIASKLPMLFSQEVRTVECLGASDYFAAGCLTETDFPQVPFWQ